MPVNHSPLDLIKEFMHQSGSLYTFPLFPSNLLSSQDWECVPETTHDCPALGGFKLGCYDNEVSPPPPTW